MSPWRDTALEKGTGLVVIRMSALTRYGLIVWVLGLLVVACVHDGGVAGAPALQSIQITPANPSGAVGTTTPLVATGIYADNSHQDITNEVKWTSSSTSVGTVSTAGVVSAVSPGTTTLTASSNGVTASATFTVTSAVIVS